MSLTEIDTLELHDNATVSSVRVDIGSSIDSIAPDLIKSDRLTFIPIHEADFGDVIELFQQTDTETLRYYSEQSFTLPDDIHQFVTEKQKQWQSSEKFEYVIEYQGDLVGKSYFGLEANMTEAMIGLWLQQRVWGNGISQERADIVLHILFSHLGVSVVKVGCVAENTQSLRSIEKYISRYGGSFCGVTPTTENRFHHNVEDLHTTTPHVEFAITKSQYNTTESGILTSIPGVEYDEFRDRLLEW